MKRLALIFTLALVAGCASHRIAVEEPWAKQAIEFERTDVQAEVDQRFRNGDLRFKGWSKSAADTTMFFPGISGAEGESLRQSSLAIGEVLFIEDLFPFVVIDTAAYQRRNTALFDYMSRFNRALLQKLVREGRISNGPNKSPEPTPRLGAILSLVRRAKLRGNLRGVAHL
jgi:hypothetical protein